MYTDLFLSGNRVFDGRATSTLFARRIRNTNSDKVLDRWWILVCLLGWTLTVQYKGDRCMYCYLFVNLSLSAWTYPAVTMMDLMSQTQRMAKSLQ